jgi:hypothetical protein
MADPASRNLPLGAIGTMHPGPFGGIRRQSLHPVRPHRPERKRLVRGARRAALTALLSVLLSAPAWAQDSTPDSVRVVVVRELSPTLAGLLEAFIPTTGYLYAGSWTRGIPLGIARIIGQILILREDVAGPYGTYDAECGTGCTIGGLLYLTGTVWAIVDVLAVVRRENDRRLEEAMMASLVPRIDATGVGFSLTLRSPW